MIRENLVLSAAVALLAAATALAEEPVVNVYNWSDYIDEEILVDFEAETGIQVVYDVFDSNNILEAKAPTDWSSLNVSAWAVLRQAGWPAERSGAGRPAWPDDRFRCRRPVSRLPCGRTAL